MKSPRLQMKNPSLTQSHLLWPFWTNQRRGVGQGRTDVRRRSPRLGGARPATTTSIADAYAREATASSKTNALHVPSRKESAWALLSEIRTNPLGAAPVPKSERLLSLGGAASNGLSGTETTETCDVNANSNENNEPEQNAHRRQMSNVAA